MPALTHPRTFPILNRKITVETAAAAVRSIDGSRRPGFVLAVYQAAAKSPFLTAAIAQSYPFTFCPHDVCMLPIAHKGEHAPAFASPEGAS